jgi:predicted phage terminase large subunit-like protein
MSKIPKYTIDNEIIEKMFTDKKIRTNITRESFWYFFHFYFAHYIKYPTADFQREIIHLLESDPTKSLYFVAFRGSGKSTIVTTAYLLWSILGKQQKKFAVVFGQTRIQAKQHMNNIRVELETNSLLRNDLGPFQEDSDEWGSYSLVFNKSGARITVASSEQSIRGIRHGSYRPDLIICDDVEDVQSTKTKEGRDKTYNWLRGEVIPLGDINTRLIMVGNLLHEDSLLMKIHEQIEKKETNGIFCFYPLLDATRKCLWIGKYPNEEAIQIEKMKVANEVSWQREYLLNIVPDEGQVIDPNWINFYDYKDLPKRGYSTLVYSYTGVDLAISQKDTADFTAFVTAHYVIGKDNKHKIYIQPNVVNKRMGFPETEAMCKSIYIPERSKTDKAHILIEKIAYQEALVQQLQNQGVGKVIGVTPVGDKRARLALTSGLIQNGQVLFPKTGCEELINQIVHFGVEKHDDLMDAFTLVVNYIIANPYREPRISFLNLNTGRIS